MKRAASLALILCLPLALVAAAPGVEEARREAAQAARLAERLSGQARVARDLAVQRRAAADALVARIDAAEAAITAADARKKEAEEAEARLRQRLAANAQPVAELTAAMASMARRPAFLAIAAPGSLADIVRTRAALDAALPAVRAKGRALKTDLDKGAALRAEAAKAVADAAAARDSLARERRALARMEQEEATRAEALTHAAFTQSDRALAFGEAAYAAMTDAERARREVQAGASLAALPGPALSPGARPAPRLARPVYRLPVTGTLIRGMGEISAAGVHSRGLTLKVAADSEAVAPAGGTIAYAGGFRSYGEIVIIDHGGGWTSLITGLQTIGVRAGDRITMGTPIGRTGTRAVAVELRRDGTPFPIAPLIAIG